MTSRGERKARRADSAAGLLDEVRGRPVPVCAPTPVYWRARWERPDPDAYAELLLEAVLEAEDSDGEAADADGDEYGAGVRRGYALGLRVAAGLYGMPEGVDPATRARMRAEGRP